MSAIVSRECDRLLALLAEQETERAQRHAELMAGFDKLDAALDDAQKYAAAMVRIVPITPEE